MSKDGSMVLTAAYDKSARVWDTASGKCLAVLASSAQVVRCAVSPFRQAGGDSHTGSQHPDLGAALRKDPAGPHGEAAACAGALLHATTDL